MLCGSKTQTDNLSYFLFCPQFAKGKNICKQRNASGYNLVTKKTGHEVEHVLAPVVTNTQGQHHTHEVGLNVVWAFNYDTHNAKLKS